MLTVLLRTWNRVKRVDSNLAELSKSLSETRALVLSGQTALNIVWTLITGFLVMFMQAGFALVETGLTRAKNVAHTMGMNFLVYAIGIIGFWRCPPSATTPRSRAR
jgi:Amt family ammonium transporter